MTRPGGPVARPDFTVLADWIEGRLDAGEAERVAAEVADAGPAVQSSIAWLERFVLAAQAVPLHTPPPLLRQQLRQHFRRRMQTGVPEHPLVPQPVTLMFDSRVDRPLAQVRGSAGGDVVHLAYRGDQADLVLDVWPLADGSARVEGQAMPIRDTGSPVFEATAVGAAATIRVVDGDDLGRFTMTPVPRDRYELRVSNGELALVAALDLRRTDP